MQTVFIFAFFFCFSVDLFFIYFFYFTRHFICRKSFMCFFFHLFTSADGKNGNQRINGKTVNKLFYIKNVPNKFGSLFQHTQFLKSNIQIYPHNVADKLFYFFFHYFESPVLFVCSSLYHYHLHRGQVIDNKRGEKKGG